MADGGEHLGYIARMQMRDHTIARPLDDLINDVNPDWIAAKSKNHRLTIAFGELERAVAKVTNPESDIKKLLPKHTAFGWHDVTFMEELGMTVGNLEVTNPDYLALRKARKQVVNLLEPEVEFKLSTSRKALHESGEQRKKVAQQVTQLMWDIAENELLKGQAPQR